MVGGFGHAGTDGFGGAIGRSCFLVGAGLVCQNSDLLTLCDGDCGPSLNLPHCCLKNDIESNNNLIRYGIVRATQE